MRTGMSIFRELDREMQLRTPPRRNGRPVRGRDRPSPARTHQLGAAAQAGVRHRHAALPELRRRGAQDHRRHPGAAGDREDPCSPGVGSAAAAQG